MNPTLLPPPASWVASSWVPRIAARGGAVDARSHVVVDWAMRYGQSLDRGAGIDALIAKGRERILAVPLYPQYSASILGNRLRRGVPRPGPPA